MASRLQRYLHALSNGIYQCSWKRSHESENVNVTSLVEKIWWWTFLLIFMFTTTLFFSWSVFSNDYNDFNWFIYEQVGIWFGWGVLIISVLVVIMFYLLLLCFSGIALIGRNESRKLHLCHKISIVCVLFLCIASYILLTKLWSEELYVAVIALIMMGPWFHICIVCVLTMSSWLLFYEIMRIQNKKAWVFAVFCMFLLFLLACLIPLFLHPPCVGDGLDSLKKPRIIAHRLGTTKYAPENTLLSYQEALEKCGDFDIETDVSISYDGIPFLFHDTKNMKRTTNVEEVFPALANQRPEFFMWEEIIKLDAGSWFLNQNPYLTVHSMSDDYKHTIKQQKIPSLFDIAKLISDNNRNQNIIFDLYTPSSDHPYVLNFEEITIRALLDAGLPQKQILWLPGSDRSKIRIIAPDVKMVSTAADIEYLKFTNISIVNVGYYETPSERVANYVRNDISVILYRVEAPWLFSYAWCHGVSYVTSNSCDKLSKISKPEWTLSPSGYVALWVCMDILFFCAFVFIFFLQYYRSDCMFLPLFQGRNSSRAAFAFENRGLELSET